MIKQKWVGNIHRTWKISDRICVLQLTCDLNKPPSGHGKTNLISIINVYAPTSQRSERYPEEKDTFYRQLSNATDDLGNKTLLFIAGDFNAKIGKGIQGDTCIGQFSKGLRNSNGHTLIELCEEKKLLVSNSAFDHPSRHQTTWIGQIRDRTTGKIINYIIFNQIDYILCQRRNKHLLTNARSYAGTLLTSDHKLVKASFNLEKHKLCRKEQHSNRTPKPNIAAIVNKEESQRRYQNTLDTKLSSITSDRKNNTDNSKARADSVPYRLKCVQTIIKQSIEESVGCVATASQNKHNDEELSQLSKRQKDIRVKIQNTKDNNKRDRLKIERNRILHTIRKRQIKLKNKEIEKKIEGINSAKCDHAMFKATRLLYQKQFENPTVEDQEGKLASNPNDILDIVSSHFKSKFEDEKVEEITPFEGEPKPLKNPITPEEVRKSFNSLSNNKAPGEDQIHAELLKYGTPLLDQTITDIFNTTFSKHENLDINTGVLIAIQKPGKKKGPPNNLRPITLLNSLRKALSIITLNRIRPFVEEYLSKSQSGFRPDRSTADVVWTHKWFAAKTLKEDVIIKISGIDMSAAFDTIDRNQLLNIIATIVNKDELRIIRFLLSNTKIKTRINGATKTNTFISNVGTPQGDSLSPVLFIVYLEHALKEVRTTLTRPIVKYEKEIPNEIAYADDVDFIGQDYVNINEIQETLHKYQLKVNRQNRIHSSFKKRGRLEKRKESGLTHW